MIPGIYQQKPLCYEPFSSLLSPSGCAGVRRDREPRRARPIRLHLQALAQLFAVVPLFLERGHEAAHSHVLRAVRHFNVHLSGFLLPSEL